MTETDLSLRLRAVEDALSIQRTQARYAACADAKYLPSHQRVDDATMRVVAERQAACFTEDAAWDGGGFGGVLEGRAAIADWFARPPWRFALHYYVAPEIDVTGDTADTRWRLWQIGYRAGEADPIMLAAITAQRFARQLDGQWLIATMRFEQIQLFPFATGLPSMPEPIGTKS